MKIGYRATAKSEREASSIINLLKSIPTPKILFLFALVRNGQSSLFLYKRKNQLLEQAAIAWSGN
jgi:hypothetical protein